MWSSSQITPSEFHPTVNSLPSVSLLVFSPLLSLFLLLLTLVSGFSVSLQLFFIPFPFVTLSTLSLTHQKVYQVFHVCSSGHIVVLIYFRLIHINCECIVRVYRITRNETCYDSELSQALEVSPWKNNRCSTVGALLCWTGKTLKYLLQGVPFLSSSTECLHMLCSLYNEQL